MFKYFVRYKYSYYSKDMSWESEGSRYVEEIDSAIINTYVDFNDIYEVRDKIKEINDNKDCYYEIITMNKL